jgi:heterodisulfide reductase subunit A
LSAENKKVLVLGGGIAGLTAARELSRMGVAVELVEKSCFLGGHAIGYCCKATDECVLCGACEVEKTLRDVVADSNIRVHLACEMAGVRTENGYRVQLRKSPQPVEPLRFSDLGDRFEYVATAGRSVRGYSKNNDPLVVAVDNGGALDAVPEGARRLSGMGVEAELEVEAIILATGFQPFDAREKPTYGYGKFANVITGLELEQIKRERGQVVRPSDGRVPASVAFIQCVGSRDERLGHLWCSRVCCPYALRMAEDLKYRLPDTDITVFYMDIQNAGRRFPQFYEKCKTDLRFVRSIPVDIYPAADDRLRIRYMEEDQESNQLDEFDLVVLSIGIMPGGDNRALSETLEVALDADGFLADRNELTSTFSGREGIFIAGTAGGPKSIADSMAHAGQAAAEAFKYLVAIQES